MTSRSVLRAEMGWDGRQEGMRTSGRKGGRAVVAAVVSVDTRRRWSRVGRYIHTSIYYSGSYPIPLRFPRQRYAPAWNVSPVRPIGHWSLSGSRLPGGVHT